MRACSSPTPTPTNYATSPPFDSPHVRHSATTAPPLLEGCGRTTSATSPPSKNPPATSPPADDDLSAPCHRQRRPPRDRNKRHVTRTEASWRIGGSEEEGKREREAPGGKKKPARRCASHTPSRLAFQTQTRRCATHTPSRLASQMRTSGVQPTHRSVQAFLSPPVVWGGILSSNGKNEAA